MPVSEADERQCDEVNPSTPTNKKTTCKGGFFIGKTSFNYGYIKYKIAKKANETTEIIFIFLSFSIKFIGSSWFCGLFAR